MILSVNMYRACFERLSDIGLFTGIAESVTATVELNAIAMKRGELAEYRPMEMHQPQFYPPPSLDFRGMYNQRWVHLAVIELVHMFCMSSCSF